MSRDLEFPPLFQTAPHRCPYLNERTAVNLLLDPCFRVDSRLHNRLLANGFRRNGEMFYRPFCNECSACVPVRVPVQSFRANRAQRRVMKRNAQVRTRLLPPRFDDGHFGIYLKYQRQRHGGDSMDDPDPHKYRRFLVDSTVNTFFLEMRLGADLVGVSVVDRVEDGLSAIYTFFDPEHQRRSPGTFAILKQIELAGKMRLKWVYLGYWISEARKMAYKSAFRPFERYDTATARWRVESDPLRAFQPRPRYPATP